MITPPVLEEMPAHRACPEALKRTTILLDYHSLASDQLAG